MDVMPMSMRKQTDAISVKTKGKQMKLNPYTAFYKLGFRGTTQPSTTNANKVRKANKLPLLDDAKVYTLGNLEVHLKKIAEGDYVCHLSDVASGQTTNDVPFSVAYKLLEIQVQTGVNQWENFNS
jgi:hypothetical protein